MKISKRYLLVFILGIIGFIFLYLSFEKLPIETIALIMIFFLVLCWMCLVLALLDLIDSIESN